MLAFLNQRRGHIFRFPTKFSYHFTRSIISALGTTKSASFTTALQASLLQSCYVSENAQGKESKIGKHSRHHDTTHRRQARCESATCCAGDLKALAPGPGDLTAAVLVSYPWSLNLRCPVTDRSEANSSCCRLPSVSASASASQPPIEMCFA